MIHTKIIATLGPATDSSERIAALLDAGVDVFRLNFSHGTLEQHARTFERIRKVCSERQFPAAVMGDLCGPKIRVDPIEDDSFPIARGEFIDIVAGHLVGNSEWISTNRPEIIHEVSVGHRILIDDGNVRLRVVEAQVDRLRCICEAAGVISTRKGMNFPDSKLVMSALTNKDREDLAWALKNEVDYIAMSFVRSAEDLRELRELLPIDRDICRVVAKVETVLAIEHLEEIIESADVVLVARGDLGVEMDVARVPIVQKQIVRECQSAGKPVIVATQMLQSMVEHSTPTRAEVSDVANAILDGADGLMLSAETSVGNFPIESVEAMSRIAEQTEAYFIERKEGSRIDAARTSRRVTTAVAHGASLLARELDAKLVAVWTATGNTARLISKTRLSIPTIGLSPDESVCRRMAMYYGVIPICLNRSNDLFKMLQEVDQMLLDRGLAQKGDFLVVVAGTRLDQFGATNALLNHIVRGGPGPLPELV